MHDERRPRVDYAPPPPRKRRPFLARPFWRDYVLAYVCIGVGAVLGDCVPGSRGSERVALLLSAALVGGAGLVIFCCAVGYSVWSVVRRPGIDE
jgi:hypothetical protein